MCWDLEIHGLATDDFDRVLEERARDLEFVVSQPEVVGAREQDCGVIADRYGDLECAPSPGGGASKLS